MGTLRYIANTSLDGYVADAEGNFDWTDPTPQVHAAINALERETRVELLGRRMYEVLKVWQDITDTFFGRPAEPVEREFGELWRGFDKIVYSRTLLDVDTPRTTLERSFDLDAVRELVASTDGVVTVGGAELAGQALQAGLVSDLHLFVYPVVVGGGTSALPHGMRLDLAWDRTETFPNGVVHLRYTVA